MMTFVILYRLSGVGWPKPVTVCRLLTFVVLLTICNDLVMG